MRQIVLDTETTGLSPQAGHRVIEIGAIEMINRRITGKQFHYYLNPDRDIDYGAQKVHGLTRAFLADKPRFSDIAHALLDFVRDAELIIHNASFDIGFLNYELSLLDKTLGVVENYAEVTDSLSLARKKHPTQKNSLDALSKRYEIDQHIERDLHGALLDARILAQVYLAMTGGQADLSLEVETSKAKHSAPEITRVDAQTFKVIHADPEELAAHAQYLQKIKEANRGQCVWLQD